MIIRPFTLTFLIAVKLDGNWDFFLGQSQDVELLAKNYMTNKGDVHFMVPVCGNGKLNPKG